jgi:hypothetical protein
MIGLEPSKKNSSGRRTANLRHHAGMLFYPAAPSGRPVPFAANLRYHLPTMIPEFEPCRLALIRHGATEWSRDGRWQGQTDMPLSAAGNVRRPSAADPRTAEKAA